MDVTHLDGIPYTRLNNPDPPIFSNNSTLTVEWTWPNAGFLNEGPPTPVDIFFVDMNNHGVLGNLVRVTEYSKIHYGFPFPHNLPLGAGFLRVSVADKNMPDGSVFKDGRFATSFPMIWAPVS